MKWTKYCKLVLIIRSWRKTWIIRVLSWGVLDGTTRSILLSGCLVYGGRRAPLKVCYFGRFCHTGAGPTLPNAVMLPFSLDDPPLLGWHSFSLSPDGRIIADQHSSPPRRNGAWPSVPIWHRDELDKRMAHRTHMTFSITMHLGSLF